MKLTPLDIRHKEFARSMRGYKDIEVDEFLDDIADEFERVFNENIDYQERLEHLEEKNEQYKNIEETLKKTLVSAQQQAEEMKQNAQKESDLILRDAELKSRSILNDSYAERQKIQRSVQALKQKQEDLKYQMKSILETYMNILENEGELELEEAGEIAAADGPAPLPEAGSDSLSPAAPGLDLAVSKKILRQEKEKLAAAIPEASVPEASSLDAAESEPAGPAPAGEAAAGGDIKPSRVRRPLDSRPGNHSDDEDPFADVEINSDDSEFKW